MDRLRVRLSLLFALLTLLPWAVVAPLALRNLKVTLGEARAARESRGQAIAKDELERMGEQASRALAALAQSAALEDFAHARARGASAGELAPAAEPWMRQSGLGVLSVLDEHGVTLTSGHVPARAGDADPQLFGLVQRTSHEPSVESLEVMGDEQLQEALAFLAVRQVAGETALNLVGGFLLDGTWAEHLSKLAGARVRLLEKGQPVLQAGLADGTITPFVLPLGATAALELGFDGAAEAQALSTFLRALLAVVALGLGLSLWLGLFAARLVTRPVEALAEGARRLERGEFEARVQVHVSGELGALVRAFNQMAENLDGVTKRLVATERIAAWQEIARRLAHELKNPLTPIRMSLETLLAAKEQGPQRLAALFEESARPMLEEVDRLARTVDAFVRFARLPKPIPAPLELSEWASQVSALQLQGLPGIHAELQLAHEVWVKADRDQLTQVLVNLLKNAAEAMPEGGTVTVTSRQEGPEAFLEVRDSGPGISEAIRAQLFTPYFTTKAEGTGLGLAISSRICQEHGGALELLPPQGKGSVFRVRLPSTVR
jgi:signal transduction histidine kinase